MFKRPAPAPDSIPEASSPAPIEKKPAHEAEAFKPSTFASRKAQSDARNQARSQRRLASLGRTSHVMKDRRGKDINVDAELFFEVDRPTRVYVDLPGQPALVPLFNTDAQTEEVTPLGEFRRGARFESSFPDASHEPAPRPV